MELTTALSQPSPALSLRFYQDGSLTLKVPSFNHPPPHRKAKSKIILEGCWNQLLKTNEDDRRHSPGNSPGIAKRLPERLVTGLKVVREGANSPVGEGRPPHRAYEVGIVVEHAVAVTDLLYPPQRLKETIKQLSWSRIFDVLSQIGRHIDTISNTLHMGHCGLVGGWSQTIAPQCSLMKIQQNYL